MTDAPQRLHQELQSGEQWVPGVSVGLQVVAQPALSQTNPSGSTGSKHNSPTKKIPQISEMRRGI